MAERTKFEQFVAGLGIGSAGVSGVACALGVTTYSVYHYLRGTRRMRARRVKLLLAFAGAALTEDDINAHYVAKWAEIERQAAA